jgi:hypothetical protein
MNRKKDRTQEHKCTSAQVHRNTSGLCPVPLSRFIGMLCVCLGLITASIASADTSSARFKEYEVKAAFIFNFLKFIDWPQEKTGGDNNQIVIGIIGEDPFGPAADIFKDKSVEEHKLVIKRFESFEQWKKMEEKSKKARLEELKSCHLLFICPSEQKQIRDIIEIVHNSSVLTVADADGFIEVGGMINFFTEDNKIRFDINQGAAEKAGLKIRSQLLRLAKRVVMQSPAAKTEAKQESN